MAEFEQQLGLPLQELKDWHSYGKRQVKEQLRKLQVILPVSVPWRGERVAVRGVLKWDTNMDSNGNEMMTIFLMKTFGGKKDEYDLELEFSDRGLEIRAQVSENPGTIHICGNPEHDHEFVPFTSLIGGSNGLYRFKTAMEVLDLLGNNFTKKVRQASQPASALQSGPLRLPPFQNLKLLRLLSFRG